MTEISRGKGVVAQITTVKLPPGKQDEVLDPTSSTPRRPEANRK